MQFLSGDTFVVRSHGDERVDLERGISRSAEHPVSVTTHAYMHVNMRFLGSLTLGQLTTMRHAGLACNALLRTQRVVGCLEMRLPVDYH